MYSTILVPLDDSAQSRRVLPYARRLAERGGGRLVLLHVLVDVGLTQHAEDMLARVSGELAAERISVQVQQRVGEPGEIIVASAATSRADMIVMATDRWSDTDGWLNGSVLHWVVRHTDVPVFVVTPDCQVDSWDPARGTTPTILVPLDGSVLSEEALPPAIALAQQIDAELVLMRAVTSEHAEEIRGAEAYLDDFTGRFGSVCARSLPPVVASTAEEGILTTARQVGANAIAMATHGRGGLARVFIGSVAARTVQQATIPVLLMKPVQVASAAHAPAFSQQARRG